MQLICREFSTQPSSNEESCVGDISMRVQKDDLEAALCAADKITALVDLIVSTETRILADKAEVAKAAEDAGISELDVDSPPNSRAARASFLGKSRAKRKERLGVTEIENHTKEYGNAIALLLAERVRSVLPSWSPGTLKLVNQYLGSIINSIINSLILFSANSWPYRLILVLLFDSRLMKEHP